MPNWSGFKEFSDEFQLKNFRLIYHNSADFTESPFFSVLGVLIYRCIFAIYCFCWIIAGSVHPTNDNEKWFIYLTNWAYLALTLYYFLSSVLTAIYLRGELMVGEYDVQDNDVLRPKTRSRPGLDQEQNPEEITVQFDNPLDMRIDEPVSWYHEALWVIYNISAANAIAVTLFYIILGYPKSHSTYLVNGLDISTYVLNTIFVLTDTSLSRVPVRLYHVVHPILFFIIYVMFCVIYWAANGVNTYGHTYVYSWLDFDLRPGVATAFIFGYCFVALVVAQLCLFGLTKLRLCVSNRIRQRRKQSMHNSLHEETA